MKYPTAVPRLALRKVALSLGTVAAASLALAGVANAAVFSITPGTTGGVENFTNAINSANTSSDASSTIVMGPGRYVPPGKLTITKNITITGDHSMQAPVGTAITAIDASNQASNSPGNFITIAPGASLTIEGVEIESGGGTSAFDIEDDGTFTMWNSTIGGAVGGSLDVASGATATLNQSTLASSIQQQVLDNGTLTMNNVSITNGGANGINGSGSTFTANNTLIAGQQGIECNGASTVSGTGTNDGSQDDDGSCGVQHSNDTSTVGIIPDPGSNGGPTFTPEMPAGTDTIGAGQPSLCPVTDQRFFVVPVVGGMRQCDIGAVTNAATRDTTPPSCTVTAVIAGPPKQQQVTVADAGSGLGPVPGGGTVNDPLTTPTNPRVIASPAMLGNPISGLGISNGSVATPAFTSSPSNAPLVLTATKTNQANSTSWWFTATDWAGNQVFCQ